MLPVLDTLLRETRDELGRNPEVVAYLRVSVRIEGRMIETRLEAAGKMEERYRICTTTAHTKMLNSEWTRAPSMVDDRRAYESYRDFYVRLTETNRVDRAKLETLKWLLSGDDPSAPFADYIVRKIHRVDQLPRIASHGVIGFMMRPITDLIDELALGISSVSFMGRVS